MDNDSNKTTVPLCIRNLEERLKNNIDKTRLGHEFGAGAPCLVCKQLCPGLDLHYWRNTCKLCKCKKEIHDVDEGENLRYHLIFNNENDKKTSLRSLIKEEDRVLAIKRTNNAEKQMKFDWIPPEVPSNIAADYLSSLPEDKLPVTGTVAAECRKLCIKKQFPIHDIIQKYEEMPKTELKRYCTFLQKLQQNAGVGQVLRVTHTKMLPYAEYPLRTRVEEISAPLRNLNLGMQHPVNSFPHIYTVEKNLQTSPMTDMKSLGRTIPIMPPTIDNALTNKMCNTGRKFVTYAGCELDDSTNQNNSTAFDDDRSGILPLQKTTVENSNAEGQDGPNIGFKSTTPKLNEGGEFPDIVPAQPSTSYRVDNENNCQEDNPVSDVASSCVLNTQHDIRCVECKCFIDDSTVAVFANKRKTYDLAWHPKCFVCSECKELLADLMYVLDEKNKAVYCGRHYPKTLNIHRCSACDELIFNPQYTFAEDQYYHLNHFCCIDCDIELAGLEYVLNEDNKNLPTCLNCIKDIYCKKCRRCGDPIGPREQGLSHEGVHWHPRCFQCSSNTCNKPLSANSFIFQGTKPYCSRECRDRN
ncbi:testin-like [Macrosteles quadrilineatus]|uniref:testin-like n=1 Tax=Macrosteles quadrilineatus TaxID=74068 RepID=UPI0023E21E1C|nr:testin-like [Macrosteles quadrilineatus]